MFFLLPPEISSSYSRCVTNQPFPVPEKQSAFHPLTHYRPLQFHERCQHFICTHDETLFRLYDRAAVGVLVAVGAAVCVAVAVTVEVTDAVAVGRGVSVAVAVTVTGHGSRRRFGRSGRCRGCCDWRTSSGGQWRSGS